MQPWPAPERSAQLLLQCNIRFSARCAVPFWPVQSRTSLQKLHLQRQPSGATMSDISMAEAGLPALGKEPAVARSRLAVALIELALAVGSFGIGTGEFAIMGLLPNVAGEFGVTTPQAGYAISAYALGVVIGAPIIAVLAAKLARQMLLLVLMAVFAVGNAVSAVAPSFESFVLLRFLTGLPHGAYFGVAALVAASLVEPSKRTQAVARVMLGLTVATLVGTPVATWFGQAMSWRIAFSAGGGVW